MYIYYFIDNTFDAFQGETYCETLYYNWRSKMDTFPCVLKYEVLNPGYFQMSFYKIHKNT